MNYITENELLLINKSVVHIVGGSNYGVQSNAAFKTRIEQPKKAVCGR